MAGYTSMIQTIGNTPLLELRRYQEQHKLKASIFAKLEGFNPAGSVKDRVALAMIEDAEQKGTLRSDSVIIEPTSGNTGIGLAAVACAKGYRVVLTMLKAYGAELVLTDGEKGMEGAIERARKLARTIEGAFLAGQFENPVNPQIHYQTTGPEIWKDLNGNVDVFVACVGTGGTLTGVGKFLKEQNPAIKIVAVEPENSPVLSGGKAGAHKIQGIGAGFLPQTLDVSVFDEVIAVSDETAIGTGKEIAPSTGILAGISSGAALAAATVLALRKENEGKNIVVLFPDSGDRYLSTELFA